jgi:hypothetical protein
MQLSFKYWVALLLTLGTSSLASAEQAKHLQADFSWSGHGQVFQIGIESQEFLGVIEGVLYVETAEGSLDDAFMECSAKQQLHRGSNKTAAQGNCSIVQSAEDNIFASYQCEGTLGACIGRLTLTSGTGKFEGISGGSEMIIRSPMRHLISALGDAEDMTVANGLARFPSLVYTLKGGKQ